MESPLIRPEGLKYRVIRQDLEAICGDVIEAAILDLFEYWTQKSTKYAGRDKTLWLRETCEIIQKQLEFTSVSVITIHRKINSLIDKNLLLTKRDKSSRSPKAKHYALNIGVINQKIKEWVSQKNTQAFSSQATEFEATFKTKDEITPSIEMKDVRTFKMKDNLYDQSFDTSTGNPPKPASSPLASAIHPSPRPLVDADLKFSTDPTQQTEEATVSEEGLAGVTVDRLSLAESNQRSLKANGSATVEPEALGEENRSPVTSEGVNSEPEASNQQDNHPLPVEKTVNAEMIDGNCDQAVITTEAFSETQPGDDELDVIFHKNTKIRSKYNKSAKCDQKFDIVYPSGDWGYADGLYLRSDEGQMLLRLLAKYRVAIEKWQEFLWYWADDSNLANWPNQVGYSKKTKVEQFNAIKKAARNRLNNQKGLDELAGSLEGFLSRLRAAESSKPTQPRLPVGVRPGDEHRRTNWTKEQIEAVLARAAAQEQAKLAQQEGGMIATDPDQLS